MEIWHKLELMQKVFYAIAFISSSIFIIQSILTFIGAELDLDWEYGHELFSLRNLINFLLGFSWSGIAFYNLIQNKFLLSFVAALIGLIFVTAFFWAMQQIQKLSEDNTFKTQNVLQKNASVYLTIPASNQGKGKIQVSLNGSVHELEAMSKTEKIETGAMVKIIEIVNNDLVIVERI